MITRNKKTKNGSSIIEIMIYLAIFTALSILVINSFIVILSSFNVTSMNRSLLESGTASMEKITREIRQAENIDASSTDASLVLSSRDGSGALVSTKFINEEGKLNLYKDGEMEGGLLDDNILITNLSFKRITTAESQAVKIEMTLEYSLGKETKSENFYNTIILRGGY